MGTWSMHNYLQLRLLTLALPSRVSHSVKPMSIRDAATDRDSPSSLPRGLPPNTYLHGRDAHKRLPRPAGGRRGIEHRPALCAHAARVAEAVRGAFRGHYRPWCVCVLCCLNCVWCAYWIDPALKAEYPGVMDSDDAKAREEIEVFRRKWIYY